MLLTNATLFASTAYHYLVIGGGTAGLTLATRLSESNPHLTVGVLEAGTWANDNPLVSIPGLYGQAVNSDIDWKFKTTPQPELNGNIIGWARGKMLGGSSGLNFMLWMRAGKEEYDSWEKNFGMKGWNWRNILKYSSKAETIMTGPSAEDPTADLLPTPPYDPKVHGHEGPVQVSFPKWYSPIVDAFFPTINAMGVAQNKEPMSGDHLGAWYSLGSIDAKDATRSYSATAYLEPNLGRKNLVVLTGTHVSKVVLEKDRKNGGVRATGVEFLLGGEKYTVKARREVVVSAGTVQSPQILELSGIGKRDVLEAAGVDVLVANENVGENLQDHHLVPITYELNPGIETFDLILTDPTFLANAYTSYNANRTGPLASISLSYAMLPLTTLLPPDSHSTLKTLAEQTASDRASLSPRNPLLDNTLLKYLLSPNTSQIEILFSPRKLSASAPSSPGKTYLSIIAAGMLPWSRGSCHITTSDPLAHPTINSATYSSSVDKSIMLSGIKFASRLSQTLPLSNFIAKRTEPPASSDELTDEEWWAHAKKTTGSVRHPIGTCAMLPKGKGGVVDERLRVYGVKGLRVVDASVFPAHLATHIQATVYGIAERAAVLIEEDWK